ncbi:hypothetical protein M885DRAFT_621805 [Pelagophyceae sp. CCMP2097]|nr:hypothetical protein M885DRAFT_621805 [Pelagophyceae sp. CCMP2097]
MEAAVDSDDDTDDGEVYDERNDMRSFVSQFFELWRWADAAAGAIVETYAKIRGYYDWVAVLDAPKVAPVLAAIEASLQRAPTAPGADVSSGVGSMCFPSYPFVNPGLWNLPVQYHFTAVARDENGHACCWKSMHRTKAVPRLEAPYSMHISPGHSRRALRKTDALAVAHLARGTPVLGTTADEDALVEFAQHVRPRAVHRRAEH